ncbi:hypothetical protein [Streptomyces sp. NPDC000410]|uniref:hypothetical protein n=1 Tax=Streptomyces sp. NPDC000410 TaxID=3154254 RepID=UPI003323EFA6
MTHGSIAVCAVCGKPLDQCPAAMRDYSHRIGVNLKKSTPAAPTGDGFAASVGPAAAASGLAEFVTELPAPGGTENGRTGGDSLSTTDGEGFSATE